MCPQSKKTHSSLMEKHIKNCHFDYRFIVIVKPTDSVEHAPMTYVVKYSDKLLFVLRFIEGKETIVGAHHL